jgi:hypothetical protein
MAGDISHTQEIREFWLPVGLSLIAALVFGLTTKDTMHDFDYTGRIASALLQGHLGLDRHPGSWLNEFVPLDGKYYSVFPLGAVLSVVPVAILQKLGWVHSFPARYLTEFIAALCVFFFFRLAIVETKSTGRRILLAFFPIFGTWTWCNLGFGGSWQIALGFALLGEVAALYFTLVRPSPFIAGAFFALAFGNRTELILSLPIYLYLIWRTTADVDSTLDRDGLRDSPSNSARPATPATPERSDAGRAVAPYRGTALRVHFLRNFWKCLPAFASFLVVPVVLGLLTAAYNFARFHSIFDFGYARIPNVLHEPWYQHGLFSLHSIPKNMHNMLFLGWGAFLPKFPHIRPYGFGCSIFLASPFLFLLFREGGKYKIVAWMAIALLTTVLWTHGNPGGWQFSYRYATILLPWMFLLIAGNGPSKLSIIEVSLFAASVTINAMATWQFLWTTQIQP